jgi:hypothetical protein
VLFSSDTDLATDMAHLEELIEAVRSGEYDLATGSRRMAESDAARPAKRDIPSAGFNGLVRLFLRSDLMDHQCGFKAFDREAMLELLDETQDRHWFWDTEVLVRAQRKGLRVKEFPVRWEPKGDSKVDLVRDVLGMGSQILRTWWQLSVAPRITPWRSFAAGALLGDEDEALLGAIIGGGSPSPSSQARSPITWTSGWSGSWSVGATRTRPCGPIGRPQRSASGSPRTPAVQVTVSVGIVPPSDRRTASASTRSTIAPRRTSTPLLRRRFSA